MKKITTKQIKTVTLRLQPETAEAVQKLLALYEEKTATKVIELALLQHIFYIDKTRALEDEINKQTAVIEYLTEQLKMERG